MTESSESSAVTLRTQSIAYVLFYAICLNIPVWIASHTQGLLLHGLFCLEYALIGIVALFAPRVVSPALVILAIALDIVYGICLTYFIPPIQLMKNISGFEGFSSIRIEWATVTALIALGFAALSALFNVSKAPLKTRAKLAFSLGAFCVAIVAAEFGLALSGTGRMPNLLRGFDDADTINMSHYIDVRPARFPSRWLLMRTLFQFQIEHEEKFARSHIVPYRNAAGEGIKLSGIGVNGDEKPNLVLIVVESWGLSTQSDIANALVAPYARADILAKYKVSQGTVPFYGATIAGEARELCGTTVGIEVMEASQQQLSDCLPDRLATAGYHNVAIHGNDGGLFNRRAWYPRIGFNEVWFKDRLQAANLPNCIGAFKGTCDAAIAGWMSDRLKTPDPQPQFLYWMTLNSHLPVPNPAPLSSPVSCSFSNSLATQPAHCAWFQLIANLHESVYKLAMGAGTRPTVIVLVGDHAPPFSDPTVRSEFSHKVVPYVVLVPRSIVDESLRQLRAEKSPEPKMRLHRNTSGARASDSQAN